MKRALTEREKMLVEAYRFDPYKPIEECEDVRARLKAGYVVYQWQFEAFVEAYDALSKHVKRLEETQETLQHWGKANEQLIEKYVKEKAKEKRSLEGFRRLLREKGAEEWKK